MRHLFQKCVAVSGGCVGKLGPVRSGSCLQLVRPRLSFPWQHISMFLSRCLDLCTFSSVNWVGALTDETTWTMRFKTQISHIELSRTRLEARTPAVIAFNINCVRSPCHKDTDTTNGTTHFSNHAESKSINIRKINHRVCGCWW